MKNNLLTPAAKSFSKLSHALDISFMVHDGFFEKPTSISYCAKNGCGPYKITYSEMMSVEITPTEGGKPNKKRQGLNPP